MQPPPPPPPAAPPYAYPQQQQRQAGAQQQQPGAHLLQPAAPMLMPPPPPLAPSTTAMTQPSRQPYAAPPAIVAPQRPAAPPLGGAYGAPQQQQQQLLVSREHPPRYLGPPARQPYLPQAPPLPGAAAPAAAPPPPPPGAFQQQRPPQQQPPTAMLQQMSLQQQQQRPSSSYPPPQQQQQQRPSSSYPPPQQQQQQLRPPPPAPAAAAAPPQQQQQQLRPPPPAPAAAAAPPQQQQQQPRMMTMARPAGPSQMQQQHQPPPPPPQQQQQLRGPPTMLPPPPPAFVGGVVVSGGGAAGAGAGAAEAGAAGAGAAGAGATTPLASRPFAPPGPPQRIDPSQIPRPTAIGPSAAASGASASPSSLRPVTHRTRSAPSQQQSGGGLSQPEKHLPPPPTSAFADCPGVAVADAGDASFRAMRPTLHSFPRSRDLARSVDVPLAVLITPLAAPLPGDDAIPLLDFGTEGPPRCRSCRAYINPGFALLDGGNSFGCNLCGEVSPAPPEYSTLGGGRLVGAVGFGGTEADSLLLEQAGLVGGGNSSFLSHRGAGLELTRGSFEFLAPPAFCARPPRPPARLFVVEASFGAGACGLTAASCRAVAAAIKGIAARAREERDAERERRQKVFSSPPDPAASAPASGSSSSSPPTLVGLMSFGAAGLHFYSFGTGGGGAAEEEQGRRRRREGEESSAELLSSSLEPSVLVVPDTDAPFSPASKGLFVDLCPSNSELAAKRLDALLALLERIPSLHGVGGASNSNPSTSSSPPSLADPASPSGAALAAGAAVLASVGGGRLHAFLGSVGSAGPRAGALALPRRGGDGAGAGVASHHFSSHSFDDASSGFDDAPSLHPPPAPWQALAEFAAERQVGVDIHLAPPAGTRPDGAGARAAAALCHATGGELRFHPRWTPAPAGCVDDLVEEAVQAVGCGVGTKRRKNGGGETELGADFLDSLSSSSKDFSNFGFFFEPAVAHGWEAVGRLRVSKGLDVLSYSGPIHRRTPLDVDFPCLNPATTLVASLDHDGTLNNDERGFSGGQAVLQFAVAFTHSASGSRRVRVHTLRLPVAENPAQVFRGADADALLACGAREVATALRGARKAVVGVEGGGNANAVVPAAAGLLLKAGSASSLAGASSSSSSLAKGADPSVLPDSIVASSSSSSNAPSLPAAALAEAAAEALSKARERARACVVGPLASYRERCAATAAGGQLILPEALKLAPLAALALSKHPAVAARGGGGTSSLSSSSSPAPPQDARAAAAAALARAAPASLSRDLTPRLLPLHLLLDAVLSQQQQQGQGQQRKKSLLAAAASLSPLPLSAEAIDASGVYCLISDSTVVLHAGGRADARLVEALGMHRSGSGINAGFVVKAPGSAASALLWSMVEELAFRRGARLSVRSTPPASSSQQQQPQQQQLGGVAAPAPQLATSALARLLPEDRSAAGPSYVEYLCWLHRQIQKRLM